MPTPGQQIEALVDGKWETAIFQGYSVKMARSCSPKTVTEIRIPNTRTPKFRDTVEFHVNGEPTIYQGLYLGLNPDGLHLVGRGSWEPTVDYEGERTLNLVTVAPKDLLLNQDPPKTESYHNAKPLPMGRIDEHFIG